MAAVANCRNIVVNEALCYIVNNYAQATSKALKLALYGFYSEEELVKAKDTIHGHGSVVCDSLPRLVKRKGDNKSKAIIDDIYEIIASLDEAKAIDTDSMPMYVAANLARIPTVSIDDLDVYNMANKLKQLDTRLVRVEHSSVKPTGATNILASDSSTSASGEIRAQPDLQRSVATRPGETGVKEAVSRPGATTMSWAQRVVTDDDGSWETANNRRRKREKRVLIGSNGDTSSSLKPARKTSNISGVKKYIVHVDNVKDNLGVEDITRYMKNLGVEAMSCFTVKSWVKPRPAPRDAESDDEDEPIVAFRVCVKYTDKDKLFDDKFWPAGIVVREWKFKYPKNNGHSSE